MQTFTNSFSPHQTSCELDYQCVKIILSSLDKIITNVSFDFNCIFALQCFINATRRMSGDTIKNLQDLLRPHLGENKRLERVDIEGLSAPGENFGSVMLKLDITTRISNGKEEMLYAVAKKIPATEFFRRLFKIDVTFKNEVAFYSKVLPTLRDFQRENGIENVLDCFADFYGARYNLKENVDVVDEDAVLVLENLYRSGKIIFCKLQLSKNLVHIQT